jgi:hypothetical protein
MWNPQHCRVAYSQHCHVTYKRASTRLNVDRNWDTISQPVSRTAIVLTKNKVHTMCCCDKYLYIKISNITSKINSSITNKIHESYCQHVSFAPYKLEFRIITARCQHIPEAGEEGSILPPGPILPPHRLLIFLCESSSSSYPKDINFLTVFFNSDLLSN